MTSVAERSREKMTARVTTLAARMCAPDGRGAAPDVRASSDKRLRRFSNTNRKLIILDVRILGLRFFHEYSPKPHEFSCNQDALLQQAGEAGLLLCPGLARVMVWAVWAMTPGLSSTWVPSTRA